MATRRPYSRSTAWRDSLPRSQAAARSSGRSPSGPPPAPASSRKTTAAAVPPESWGGAPRRRDSVLARTPPALGRAGHKSDKWWSSPGTAGPAGTGPAPGRSRPAGPGRRQRAGRGPSPPGAGSRHPPPGGTRPSPGALSDGWSPPPSPGPGRQGWCPRRTGTAPAGTAGQTPPAPWRNSPAGGHTAPARRRGCPTADGTPLPGPAAPGYGGYLPAPPGGPAGRSPPKRCKGISPVPVLSGPDFSAESPGERPPAVGPGPHGPAAPGPPGSTSYCSPWGARTSPWTGSSGCP